MGMWSRILIFNGTTSLPHEPRRVNNSLRLFENTYCVLFYVYTSLQLAIWTESGFAPPSLTLMVIQLPAWILAQGELSSLLLAG